MLSLRMDDEPDFPNGFRIFIIALQTLGLVFVLLLLVVTVAYHIYRHPVINALFVALLLHAVLCIWPGIFDAQIRRDISTANTLESATSLILFCAADAVLDRYMEVTVAAFNVSIMLAILSQARRALHTDPQDITRDINTAQSQLEPTWKIASLCFGPFIWALPILFAPLPHLMDKDSPLIVYSTLYCDIPGETFRILSLVFLFLPLVTAVIISLWIVRCLVVLYQRYRNTVSFGLYLPLGRRFTAMAAITLFSTILLVINASTKFTIQPLVGVIVFWEALVPVLQFLIFASQQELLPVWWNWLHFNFNRGATGSGSSSYSVYSLRQFPNAVRPNETTTVSIRASRSLPPLPSEVDLESNGTAQTRRRDSKFIQLDFPGSRLSIPSQLRNRTPTPTPQLLSLAATKGSHVLESHEERSLFTPASDLDGTRSTRPTYHSPELPPIPPTPNSVQSFYSRLHSPQRPTLPSRHRSLPAQVGKKPLILASVSMRGSASPYEIPPPPAVPPPAPSSTASRSASVSSSLSQSTARSSRSRSLLLRFAPNGGRRSVPVPIRQPTMKEVGNMRDLLAQFPSSPGSSAFPTMGPPTAVQDSAAIGPILETIRIAVPSPVAQRPATINQSLQLNRDRLAESRQQIPSILPSRHLTKGRDSSSGAVSHDHLSDAYTPGGMPGSPSNGVMPSADNTAQTEDVRAEFAQRPWLVHRPGSVSRRGSLAVVGAGLPSVRRDSQNVPPVPTRPTSVATPVFPTPARTRSRSSLASSERAVGMGSPRSATRIVPSLPRVDTNTGHGAPPASSASHAASRTPRESLPPPPLPPKQEYTRTWI